MVNGVEGRGHNLGRGVPDRMAHFTIKQWGRDPHDVNNNEKDGLTPLHIAAEMGFLDMGVWLMQHGARESLSLGDALGRTPLFKAVWYGHEDMANWVSSAAFGGDPSAMMAG